MYEKDRVAGQAEFDKFEYLSPMLDSALAEMREFSKRKHDGIVSEMKIKILNRILSDIREILSGEETVTYLDPLDEQDLPQNSDAVLVLGQYRAAFDSFKHGHQEIGSWVTRRRRSARG